MIRTALKALARNSSPAGARLMAIGGANWVASSLLRSTRSLAPLSVKIGVNSSCNARCKTCDIGTKTELTPFYTNNIVAEAPEIDLDLATSVVDALRHARPKICIDSTEPLLYRHLGALVEHVSARHMQSLVLTNGLLLSDRARGLVEAGLDELVVSIDGPAAINDEVRGLPGLTAKAYAGLEEVRRVTADRAGKGPVLRINAVISAHSQDHLLDLLHELAALEVGLTSVTLYHQNFVSRDMAERHNSTFGIELPVAMSNCEQADPEAVDVSRLAEQVRALQVRPWPFSVRWVPAIEGKDELRRYYSAHHEIVGSSRCLAPWMIMRVKPNGDVGVIGRCFDIPFGNCRDENPLQLFNGVSMRLFRRVLLDNDLMPACTRCCGSL
jgi:MoaA/NifB/PqqE/SkfB family radical SAM enzyme